MHCDKNMALQFEIIDSDSGIFADHDTRFPDLVDAFDEILDDHDAGRLTDKAYLAALQNIVTTTPDFVDAHAHIASHWHRQGKPKKALDAALLGLSAANRCIPEGFTGRIEWGHIENRPYLRALQLAMLSYIRLRRHKDAIELMEIMLARNPGDNQGVRFILGSEAMRGGDHARARAVFESEATSYPPYFYEWALSHIIKGEWVAAATALRRGFCANSYIAEILGGNPNPAPLAIWHGSSFSDPETASDYIKACGALWYSTPWSFEFVRWVFNQPKVMLERAAFIAGRESALWEEDSATRIAALRAEEQLIEQIDDRLSVEIVTKRKNRRGQMVWPWLY